MYNLTTENTGSHGAGNTEILRQRIEQSRQRITLIRGIEWLELSVTISETSAYSVVKV